MEYQPFYGNVHPMKNVDTILHARWILPITESDPLLHDH
ncbi:hypothetical protein MNBD_GAMMA07-2449, partial [hydrothermal vent metagenome]